MLHTTDHSCCNKGNLLLIRSEEHKGVKVLQSQNQLTSLSDNGGSRGMDISIWKPGDESALDLVFLMWCRCQAGSIKHNRWKMYNTRHTISSNLDFLLGSAARGEFNLKRCFLTTVLPLKINDSVWFTRVMKPYLGVQQIQANSVVHDVTIVRHVPIAAERKGTVSLY